MDSRWQVDVFFRVQRALTGKRPSIILFALTSLKAQEAF